MTVHREAGLRFIIFVDDHEPAHVHVIGDGAAKIILFGAGSKPQLVSNDGLKGGDLRKALRIVAERQATLLERWRNIHG